MSEEKNFQVRTDLAVEARDMYVEKDNKSNEINGVAFKEVDHNGIKVAYVEIDNEGEERIGKKSGNYITIYADGVKKQDTNRQKEAAKILAAELRRLLEKIIYRQMLKD